MLLIERVVVSAFGASQFLVGGDDDVAGHWIIQSGRIGGMGTFSCLRDCNSIWRQVNAVACHGPLAPATHLVWRGSQGKRGGEMAVDLRAFLLELRCLKAVAGGEAGLFQAGWLRPSTVS